MKNTEIQYFEKPIPMTSLSEYRKYRKSVRFLSRVSTLTRDIDVVILSVHHVRSGILSKMFVKLRRGHPLRWR